MKLLGFLLAITIVLGGCAESPQNQLISAAMLGDVVRVDVLLNDPSVDINWKGPRSGNNALTSAAAFNKVAVVQLLLRRGADPNIATDKGEAPLQSAAYHGNREIVKMLVDAGADVNTAETLYGFTPLTSAARNGHVEVIRLLLDSGADRRARIKDGRTALELAQHYGHPNAANVLMFYEPGAATQAIQ